MSWRVLASSLSLPFINLAANPSMFLPSVTSVTLEARAASSFSTGEGSGNGEVCASIGAASVAAPNTKIAIRFFILGSLLLIGAAM